MPERTFYYCGKELRPMQDYTNPILFGEERYELDEFTSWLCRQKYTVLCSKVGFENFINATIREGNIGLFKYSLQKFNQEWPRRMYHLTDEGILNIAHLEGQ